MRENFEDIKIMMRLTKVSQTDISEKLNIHQSNLNRYLKGLEYNKVNLRKEILKIVLPEFDKYILKKEAELKDLWKLQINNKL